MRADYSRPAYLSYAEAERILDDAFGWGAEMRTTIPREFNGRGGMIRTRQDRQREGQWATGPRPSDVRGAR